MKQIIHYFFIEIHQKKINKKFTKQVTVYRIKKKNYITNK